MTFSIDQGNYHSALLQTERWAGLTIRWCLLIAGVISTGLVNTYGLFPLLALGGTSYALFTLVFTYVAIARPDLLRRIRARVYLIAYLIDVVFASLVIVYSGGLVSDMYLLYGILALKSALYFPLWHQVLLIPYALGPLYVLILRVSVGSWYFLTGQFFLLRYGLLFVLVLLATYVGWLGERVRYGEARLSHVLAERTADLDNKTRAMQQMAINLGNRVLELRTLQDGIKAISSALALEDVLRLIITNVSQVLEGTHCSVALLSEIEDGIVLMAAPDRIPDPLAGVRSTVDKAVAECVIKSGKPVLSGNVKTDARLALDPNLPISSAMGVPLFLEENPIGALVASSASADAFSAEDLNHLDAFAGQAAVAVKNARLYEQLVQEQKQTAQLYQHVQERRDELEAILRGIGDGVIVTDTSFTPLLMNPVAVRIFQVRPETMTGVPLFRLIPNEELIALFREAMKGEQHALVQEITLSSATEEQATIYQALASPIWGADGNVRGVVTVLRDITSQKELERMKSNFLSVVSHELKTPLHSIKGFVDIILMGKTGTINETQADFLGTVRDQTAHLQNLINDLLEFSRLESGQIQLRLSELSLEQVAAGVVDKLKPLADQSQVRLVNRIGPEIPLIEADLVRIEQVVTNLVGNAIKFTPAQGSITLAAEDLGDQVLVSVSDTGIGIPANELDRVFERFYQVDKGSARQYSGTGLGLTISKHIIEHHQGRIWVESTLGKGTTFFFALPKRLAGTDETLMLDFLSLPPKSQPPGGKSSNS